MCSHPYAASQLHQHGRLWLTFIYFLFDILILLYPKLLSTGLLLLLSAPPSHWLPPQALYLPLSPVRLSPLYFDLSDNPLNVSFFFFIYFLCQPFF